MNRNRIPSLKTWSLVVAAAGALTLSCGGESEGALESTASESSSLYAILGPGLTLWNGNNLGAPAAIPVCWVTRPRVKQDDGVTVCPNQTSDTKDCQGNEIPPATLTWMRNTVRAKVEDSWQRVANLEFYGWGNCPIDAATNKVKDANLPGQMLVTFSDGDVAEVMGKASFRGNPINLNWQSLLSTMDFYATVHEFGHSLGFSHEYDRPLYQTPAGCVKDAPAVGTSFALTDFVDYDSIMDKCEPISVGHAGELSPGDVLGAQRAYGRKYDGSIVGFRGQCVDVAGASTANGASVVAFPCRGQENDKWSRVSNNEYFRATISGSQRCLNVSGGTVTPSGSTPVVSSTCGSAESEKFRLENVEWRAMGNMCVQAVSNRLEVHPCDGSSAQQWTFMEGSTSTSLRWDQIKSTSTGKCVAAQTATGDFGEELVLATCSPTNTKQRFAYPGKGIIGYGGFCADVLGGLPAPGARLGFWNGCADAVPPPNSQFSLSGQLKALGQCLDILGGVANPGDGIGVYPCAPGAPNEAWDYYF